MEEIRKFKYEYAKRRQLEDADWQQEVKREIQRIKQKNKALENARKRRMQQIQTMQKLQCLNIAKTFLSSNFKKSMQHLADKKHWRNTFKDQLNVDFKDWMYNSISDNLSNKAQSANFKDGICTDQLMKIGAEKDPIKRTIKDSINQRAKSRQIESVDKRVVHFLFNPTVQAKISPWARKYAQYKDGSMAEIEAKEKEQFDGYVENLIHETLEEGQTNPIEYGNWPEELFHCEITGGITKLSFSTADDPFYKTSIPKHYPEAVVFNKEGKQLAKINPESAKDASAALTYLDDVRDPVLKINDDKKIQISLGAIKEPGTMILLTIKEFDTRGKGF